MSLFAACLSGQALSSLSGVITDPSGAVVPRAVISLTNNSTGAKRTIQSGSSGLYSFEQVTPGTHSVVVKAAGFSTKTLNGVELLVNTPSTLNIGLALGTSADTVTVVADAAQVNTTDASLGNAIGAGEILELPLEARNPAGLLALQAGVTYFGPENSNAASSANRLNGSVNGSKPDQNNITLDGVDVNDQNARSPLASVLRVTLDSVQEFRTTTENPAADQGHGSGAQIALVTKSGTNTLHGSLYEFVRNTATSANSFFNNLSGIPRQKLNRNVFGGTAGGPIRTDKLFFFVNYEGRRDDSESTAVRVVPSATLRQGSVRYLNSSGGVSTLTATQLRALDPTGVGPGSAVLSAFNQYPAPNDSTVGDGFNTAGYRFVGSAPLSQNAYIAKVDYTLGKSQFFLRGNLQIDKADALPQLPGQGPASSALDHSKGLAAGWTYVIAPNFLSTFRFGYTRYGVENTGSLNSPYVSFYGLDSLNATTTDLTRIIPVTQFSEDLSWTHNKHTVAFGGQIHLAHNKSVNMAGDYPQGTVTIGYLEKAGAGLDPADLNANFSTAYRVAAADLLGPVTLVTTNYRYDLSGQVQPFGQALRRNYGLEEYSLYLTDTWRITKALTINAGLNYTIAPPVYEANGYQVSPTTDLGNWFAQRGALANNGLSQEQAGKVSFVLANSANGQPLYKTQINLAPRIALAYSPQGSGALSRFLFGGPGKTSIRAGFGVFYDLFGMSLMSNFDASQPGLTTVLRSPFGAPLATQPRFAGSTNLPSSLVPAAPQGGFPYTPGSGFFGGFAISNSIDQNLKQPYTMNPSFSIGRDLGKGWFVQGSYVGRLSRRSLVVTDLAQPTNLRDPKSGQTYWDAINALAVQARRGVPVSQIKPQPLFEDLFSGYASGGLTATQQVYAQEVQYYSADLTSALFDLDIFCYTCSNVGSNAMFNSQYASLFAYRSIGGGSYHAMQWNVRKRLSKLLLDFNYTFAKSIDLTSAPERDFYINWAVLLNPYNPKLSRGVSDFDVRHSVNGSAVYKLPVGRGERFGSNLPRLADTLLGGWQVASVFTAGSSLPKSVLNSGAWPTNWSFSGYATAISPLPPTTNNQNAPGINGVGGPNVFSNPQAARASFDYTYAGQIGSRNVLRGDGLLNVDLSLAKRFVMPYNETHSLQIRAEAFNVANTVRFDINTASLDIGTTGTFGKYTSTLTTPRVIQFGVRYEF